VNTAWSYAPLSLDHWPLLESLSAAARSKISAFGSQELANTAWACSNLIFSNRTLLDALAAAAIRKLTAWRTQDLQNTAWSYYMLSFADKPLLTAISRRLRAQGELLDEGDPPGHHIAEYRWRTRSNDPWEPWVSLFMRDMAVIMKPAAW